DVPQAPPPEASGETAGLPAFCRDAPFQVLEAPTQNYSLAAEYYRAATATSGDPDRRSSWCAAATYLRWMVEYEPMFTGGEPDDRSFRRLAAVYEAFAADDPTNRRAHLDSALAIRARGLALMRNEGLPVAEWRRALSRGRFFYTYADDVEGAVAREARAYNDAIQAAPDSVSDWYLRRLVTLTAQTMPEPLARADALDRLAPLADDAELREYIPALAAYLRSPQEAIVDPVDFGDGVSAFARGDYADCTPINEVRRLFAAASQSPEAVEASGGDPDAITDALLDCMTDDVSDPARLAALFTRSWRRGDLDTAEAYFQRALEASDSDRARSRLYTQRAARGQGNARSLYSTAVRFDPLNARAQYALVRIDADLIGVPRTLTQRAVYWCLSDRLDEILAIGDPEVGPLARRTRDGYRRAAPSRDEWFFAYRAGEPIRARSGGYACTTEVR
ncbi:MAG: hypothetical protein AAFQ43_12875, partial [Bacteroidota bacterium]